MRRMRVAVVAFALTAFEAVTAAAAQGYFRTK